MTGLKACFNLEPNQSPYSIHYHVFQFTEHSLGANAGVH